MATECADCGLPYGGRGWIDAVIPKKTWIEISPTGDEGGLLCITCMAGRLQDRGLDNITVVIGSGPFSHHSGHLWQLGWRTGHKVGLEEAQEHKSMI